MFAQFNVSTGYAFDIRVIASAVLEEYDAFLLFYSAVDSIE